VINIVWPKAAWSIEHMVQNHLPDLQNAAAEIVGLIRDQGRAR
jgi:hypothetical protein